MEAASIETGGKKEQSPEGICILLLESDATCLTIISKMLCKCGYRVISTKRATDALCIIRERGDTLDLVLAETHLPDTDNHELLETITEISDLPVVAMSADEKESAILGCLFKGSVFYLLKPIIMDDLKNLWQFAVRNKRDDPSRLVLLAEGIQDRKRKTEEEMMRREEETVYIYESRFPKKQELTWTDDLENRFMQAITDLGIGGAYSTNILKHMDVPGLSAEDIPTHLQNYCLALTCEEGLIEKSMFTSDHRLAASNSQGGFLQSSENLGSSANSHKQVESSSVGPKIWKAVEKTLPGIGQLDPNTDLAMFQQIVASRDIDLSYFQGLGFEKLTNWPVVLEDSIQEKELQQQQFLEAEEQSWAEKGEDELFGAPRGSTQQSLDEFF